MLSISKAMRAGQGNYYLELAREDYYVNGGEPPGHWLLGAKHFGLEGHVEKDDLRKFLGGYAPRSGKGLVQNAGDDKRQAGWDLTWSPPKSVSVFWALAPQEIREQIQSIQQESINAILGIAQERAAFSRRGNQGESVERCEFVVASFEHGTSRAQDPQLHTHTLVINVGVRADGTTGTILSKPLFQHKMLLGALYRAELAARLQRDLGLKIVRDKEQFFAVKGISQAVCEAFSQRRAEIEKILDDRGLDSAVAAKVAALDSRQVKKHVAREALSEEWRETAQKHGCNWGKLKSLLGKFRLPKSLERRAKRLVAQAIKDLSAKNSYFTEKDVIRVVAEQAPGTGLDAQQIIAGVRRGLLRHGIVDLGICRGEPTYTTRAQLKIEKAMLQQVGASMSNSDHIVKPSILDRILQSRFDLTQEQKDAVRHITSKKGSVQALTGLAGTAKTSTLGAAREVWDKAGYTVIGAAVTGKAARGLEESAGIKSATISKTLRRLSLRRFNIEGQTRKVFPFAPKWHPASKLKTWRGVFTVNLTHIKVGIKPLVADASPLNVIGRLPRPSFSIERPRLKLTKKTILVVDEAGMVNTADLAALIAAATKARAKIVLVGDSKQLQPIGPGGAFKAISEMVSTAKLTEIKRQSEEWARDMVKLFSEGKAEGALAIASKHKLIHQAETRDKLLEKLLRKWRRQGVAHPEQNLILAGNNQDVDDLNRMAQKARKRAGWLGRVGIKIKGERIHRGDRVMFEQNSRTLNVENGVLGIVTKISKEFLHARLDSGPEVIIPLRHYEDVRLGYAVTAHKAQGITTRNSFVLIDPNMQNWELTYVEASRARDLTHFYVDRATAGPELKDLASLMKRSDQKEMASTLREERLREEEAERERQRREEEQRRQQQTRSQSMSH